MKICALLPSGTEILFALGLGQQVAGVTQFCDYPEEAKTRPVVSRGRVDTSVLSAREAAEITKSLDQSGEGTYVFDTEWLYRERPDVILTQDLCRVCDLDSNVVVKALADFQPPPKLLYLSPKSLSDVFNTITVVGDATGTRADADALVQQLQSRIQKVARRSASAKRKPRVFVLEWIDPLGASGHWVPEMVALAGGKDELGTPGEPSVLLSWERIFEYDPEIILMTPCSCRIERTLRDVHTLARREGWWDIQAVRDGQVYVIEPVYFTRPGPRIVQGLEIMAELLHPELFTDMIPPQTVVKLEPPAQKDRLPEELAQHFRPYLRTIGSLGIHREDLLALPERH